MANAVQSSENGDYCSIAEAMKIVSQPFDGNKSKLREFVENVDVVFELVNPSQHDRLLKFVKARITGDARSKLMVRDLTHTWAQVKAILEENYAVRRTLDFYACAMFNAKQHKGESIASWGSRIDAMQTELRDAARRVSNESEEAGAVALVNHLAKACFIQGLENERIQTIVRSKGEALLLPTAVEVALEEESAILSAIERGKSSDARSRVHCDNCGKRGHLASKCYYKNKKPCEEKGIRKIEGIKCFRCGKQGHMARECRYKVSTQGSFFAGDKEEIKEGQRGFNPKKPKQIHVGSISGVGDGDSITLHCPESKSGKLCLLLDTGADVSLIKSSVLKRGTNYYPAEKVRVKGITEDLITTEGRVTLTLEDQNKEAILDFQLIDGSRFSLSFDGIIGRDLLRELGAVIYVEQRKVFMRGLQLEMDKKKKLECDPVVERRIKIPARCECIVKVPTTSQGEGVLAKEKLEDGVYLAEVLTIGVDGECTASAMNTTDKDVECKLSPRKEDASGKQKWRIVVDYRKLNDVTVGDAFPLPLITEILDQLGKARYFSTLDLASGYHQIPKAKDDQHKTAFSTFQGHSQFKRMPFGLKGAPATFQRLMNTVLSGLQGLRCFVYLDNIVIFGNDFHSHNDRSKEVFGRLREYGLKLQPEKCEFLRTEVNYLGHVISEEGVKPDPGKVEMIHKFPRPKNTKQLQSFLGLAGYYRRFIHNFSQIARPLHELLKKNAEFEWKGEQEEAFQNLKEILMTEPILQYPDFSRPFLLTTDASNKALGAILSQGTPGKDLPIAYASRALNKAEKNYSTIEKELLAIVWGTQYFRPYLYGRKFTIITDHKPLTWIFNVKDPSSRLMRWRIKMEEYDYEIIYKKGKLNSNADALSRIWAIEASENESSEVETREQISKERKEEILREIHDSPVGGHQGMNRTYERVKLYHKWPGMKSDVEKYIRSCDKCQKNKLTKPKTKMPMVITQTPETVFEKCNLDIVGPFPVTSQENKYLLTFQDDLRRSRSKIVKELKSRMQESHSKARKLLMEAKEKNKTEYDKNSNPQLFLEGDKVLLFDETVRRERSKKLSSQWGKRR
ncbi:uncharacterized protein LOC124161448 [Ischnura elegans]|uniref:uncharacterized protein LOC124161448 n=1 Tax=Ischnura elegans TaxID=197161 RepID=UPI001ED8A085|nr:uncharacterized protein LOC124161448 [Ischnura elegans]